ncbi:cupin domain-containing protein [Rosenbergiella australiborealis]|uniref:Cupin domain-containing protein n=1 Tax=Rosenbergiella australiborealis TaxID=1544696 RepID=A0ABS5T2L5_9GAMM|nr:cupin domain-containing protein [Rosenbergiella australiborealis]MBT0726579.1 cupin domain-containing protein [Rosenbergiella australiborealis]
MANFTRRNFMSFAAGGTMMLAAGEVMAHDSKTQAIPFQADFPGPHDPIREQENRDIVDPPSTDSGTLPNLCYSFSDAHIRRGSGGWTRQVTNRELGAAKTIAGVDMRLNAGGIRELHWHKEGEWAFVTYGHARVTAFDTKGGWFIDDISVGDLWYFPPGIPHSIQGIGDDGCEFLLAFDDGGFDEDSTFLLSDWFKHIPPEVLAKNFNVPVSTFSHLPSPESEYMFAGKVPGDITSVAPQKGKKSLLNFTHHMMDQTPITSAGGSVRITDSSNFPISKTIAAALVEIAPGGMRELHWHPNNDEWQYYLSGQGRMGVFASSGQARTFDFRAGDVGYVPFAMGHYVENTGDTPLRFLELFKSDYYADISLNQWLASTPSELVQQHLHLDDNFMNALSTHKNPVVK